jgi:hypothetical protein
MAHFRQAALWQSAGERLRTGRWLTADRAHADSLILLAFYATAAMGWIVRSNGLVDRNGTPIGTDFTSFYAAGSMAPESHATAIYDMAAHYAREQQILAPAFPILTAGLLGAALLALPLQPFLSGILFGLPAYKPQFGLLIPMALLVTRRRGPSAPKYGERSPPPPKPRANCCSNKATPASRNCKAPSPRSGCGGISLAYLVQSAVSLAAIGAVAWIWRSGRDRELKAAPLVIATLLASPHTLDYDLAMLGPAVAFVVPASIADGLRDCDISLLAAAWIARCWGTGWPARPACHWACSRSWRCLHR